MNLVHLVSLRLIPGAGTAQSAAPTVIGRRRRTRTYRTPTPDALKEEYQELKAAAPEKLRALIGPYLLRGDVVPNQMPPVAAIDWESLSHDAETVVKLFDMYLEYIDEEEVTVLLLGEF